MAVALHIDGKKIKVPEGATVLDAARKAGIAIPHLCDQEGMPPYGACRVCTVEITANNRTRLQTACNYPVTDGIRVSTNSPKVIAGRKIILELLLARCGEVDRIRDFAGQWGVEATRFVSRTQDDCILCGLCVRACKEIVGSEALSFSGRGVFRKVDVPFGYHPESCIACGLCVYVCPTGKMQMEHITADLLRSPPGTEKKCRYMLMGLVSAKTCPENIRCSTCHYDQLIEETLETHPAIPARRGHNLQAVISGPFTYDPSCSYRENHTWVRKAGKVCLVGVDHFTTCLLPPLDSVSVDKGRIILTAGDTVLSLDMPVEGELLRVNPQLEAVPRLAAYSPYQRGWVAILEADTDLSSLRKGSEAIRWFDSETQRLYEKNLLGDSGPDRGKIAQSWDAVVEGFFSNRKAEYSSKQEHV